MNILRRWFDQLFPMGTEPVVEGVTRGRIRRVNVLANGDRSVVVRIGMEEGEWSRLRPGVLVECRVVEPPYRRQATHEPTVTAAMRAAIIQPLPSPICDCDAPGGYPHEPDCIWWDAQRYDQVMAEEYGKPVCELTAEDRTSPAMMAAHERTVARLDSERAAAEMRTRGQLETEGGNDGSIRHGSSEG